MHGLSAVLLQSLGCEKAPWDAWFLDSPQKFSKKINNSKPKHLLNRAMKNKSQYGNFFVTFATHEGFKFLVYYQTKLRVWNVH